MHEIKYCCFYLGTAKEPLEVGLDVPLCVEKNNVVIFIYVMKPQENAFKSPSGDI